jgi:hypothetical protein
VDVLLTVHATVHSQRQAVALFEYFRRLAWPELTLVSGQSAK